MTTATYELLSDIKAIITVTYAGGGVGVELVTITRGSIYDAAYAAASVKATMQGQRLERFSRE